MKILYYSTAIIPSHYANSVHVMKMSAALSENGHNVTLIARLGEKCKDVYEYYNVKENFFIELIKNDIFGILRRIVSIFKNTQYDLFYTRYTLAAFIYSCILNKKVIYEYHSITSRKLNKWMERRIAKQEFVEHVFITKALKNAYESIIPELRHAKTIVLPDGADANNIVKDEIPTENCNLNCGYIGSFQRGKGVELVIEIANKMPDIMFHIVGGNANEIDCLQASVKNKNVIWYGHLCQEEAMRILNTKIDIALLPNQKSVLVGKNKESDIGGWTSPMKLFEYMSYKKAIIASDISVLKEILKDGYNALLADPDDPNLWCEKIRYLCKNTDVYSEIRNNAYHDLVNLYTWKSRARKVMEPFNN